MMQNMANRIAAIQGIAAAVLLAALAGAPAPAESQAPAEGLVGFWNFDKVENARVLDLSGNGNDGEAVNAEFTELGRINGCLTFNGKDACVQCGPAAKLGLSDAFTIAAWAWPETQYRHRLVTFASGNDGFMFHLDDNLRLLGYWFGNSAMQRKHATASVVGAIPNRWVHVAITYDNGAMTGYFNGVLLRTDRLGGGPVGIPDADVFIGRDKFNWFKGRIDEVRIYRRALGPQEIQQLCNALPDIPVAGIALDRNELSLAVNAASTLTWSIDPWHAKNQTVTVTSSDPAVATISERGEVTGMHPGQATITAAAADGRLAARCSVEVHVQTVTEVSFKEQAVRVEEGKTQKLESTIEPADATHKDVTWSSADPRICTVDADGVVKGMRTGTTAVTATADDQGLRASCEIAVWKQPVAGISLNKTETTIRAGHFEQLAAFESRRTPRGGTTCDGPPAGNRWLRWIRRAW